MKQNSSLGVCCLQRPPPEDFYQDEFHQHESSSSSQILHNAAPAAPGKELIIMLYKPGARSALYPSASFYLVPSHAILLRCNCCLLFGLTWSLADSVWWTWQLDILVSPDRLCLVTEVFLSSLSDASGSVLVTRPGFRFLVSFPRGGIACRVRSIRSGSCCWARPHPVRSGVFSDSARRMFRSHCLCWKKQNLQRMLVSLQFPTQTGHGSDGSDFMKIYERLLFYLL